MSWGMATAEKFEEDLKHVFDGNVSDDSNSISQKILLAKMKELVDFIELRPQLMQNVEVQKASKQLLNTLKCHDKSDFLRSDDHHPRIDIAYLYSNPVVCEGERLDYQPLVPKLNYAAEAENLIHAIHVNSKTRPVSLLVDVASFKGTQRLLIEHRPRVLHICCHGGYMAKTDSFGTKKEFCLEFEKELGCRDLIGVRRLQALIGTQKDIDLVVVSACHSLDAGQVFLDAGVQFVIAVHSGSKILDDACKIFTEALYHSLFLGLPVPRAFSHAQTLLRDHASNSSIQLRDLHTCCCSHPHRSTCPFGARLRMERKFGNSNLHARICVPDRALCRCGLAAEGAGDVVHLDTCQWVQNWASALGFDPKLYDGRTVVLSGESVTSQSSAIRSDAEGWVRQKLNLHETFQITEAKFFGSEKEKVANGQESVATAALDSYIRVRFAGKGMASEVLRKAAENRRGNKDEDIKISKLRVCCCAPHIPHNEACKFVLLESSRKVPPRQGSRGKAIFNNANEEKKESRVLNRLSTKHSVRLVPSRLTDLYAFVRKLSDLVRTGERTVKSCGIVGKRGVGKNQFARQAVQYFFERSREAIQAFVNIDLTNLSCVETGLVRGNGTRVSSGEGFSNEQQKLCSRRLVHLLGSGMGLKPPPQSINDFCRSTEGTSCVFLLTNIDRIMDSSASIDLVFKFVRKVADRNSGALFVFTADESKSELMPKGCQFVFELTPLSSAAMQELVNFASYSSEVHRRCIQSAMQDPDILKYLDGRPARFHSLTNLAKIMLDDDGAAPKSRLKQALLGTRSFRSGSNRNGSKRPNPILTEITSTPKKVREGLLDRTDVEYKRVDSVSAEAIVVRVLSKSHPYHLHLVTLMSYFERGGMTNFDLDVLWPKYISILKLDGIKCKSWGELMGGLEGPASEYWEDDPYARIVSVSDRFHRQQNIRHYRLRTSIGKFIQDALLAREKTLVWPCIWNYMSRIGSSLVRLLKPSVANELSYYFVQSQDSKEGKQNHLEEKKKEEGPQPFMWYDSNSTLYGVSGSSREAIDIARACYEVHHENFTSVFTERLESEYSADVGLSAGQIMIQLSAIGGLPYVAEAMRHADELDLVTRSMLNLIAGNIYLTQPPQNLHREGGHMGENNSRIGTRFSIKYYQIALECLAGRLPSNFSLKRVYCSRAQILVKKGLAWSKLQEFAEARTQFSDALGNLKQVEVKSDSSLLLRLYGETKKQIGITNLNRSRALVESKLGILQHEDPQFAVKKISLREAKQNLVEAELVFKSLEDTPQLNACYQHLARAHLASKEYPKAMEYARKAMRLLEDDVSVLHRPRISNLLSEIRIAHNREMKHSRLILLLFASPLPPQKLGPGYLKYSTSTIQSDRDAIWEAAKSSERLRFGHQRLQLCRAVASKSEIQHAAASGCAILHLSCGIYNSCLHLERGIRCDQKLDGLHGSSDPVGFGELGKLLRTHWRLGFRGIIVSLSGNSVSFEFEFQKLLLHFPRDVEGPKFLIGLSSREGHRKNVANMCQKEFLRAFYSNYFSGKDARVSFLRARKHVHDFGTESKDSGESESESGTVVIDTFIHIRDSVAFNEVQDSGDESGLSLTRVMSAPLIDPSQRIVRHRVPSIPKSTSKPQRSILKKRFSTRVRDETVYHDSVEDVSKSLCYTQNLKRVIPAGNEVIGRQRDIADTVAAILQNRIVLLEGSDSGVGTTVVATEAAEYLRKRHVFPDGILVIDARGVDSVDELFELISQNLSPLVPRVQLVGNFEELAFALRDFQTLIILEHVEEVSVRQTRQFLHFMRHLKSETEHMRLLFTSNGKKNDLIRKTAQVIFLQPLNPEDSANLLLDRCTRQLKQDEIVAYLGGSFRNLSKDFGPADCESKLLSLIARHPLLSGLRHLPRNIVLAAEALGNTSLEEWSKILSQVRARDFWHVGRRSLKNISEHFRNHRVKRSSKQRVAVQTESQNGEKRDNEHYQHISEDISSKEHRTSLFHQKKRNKSRKIKKLRNSLGIKGKLSNTFDATIVASMNNEFPHEFKSLQSLHKKLVDLQSREEEEEEETTNQHLRKEIQAVQNEINHKEAVLLRKFNSKCRDRQKGKKKRSSRQRGSGYARDF